MNPVCPTCGIPWQERGGMSLREAYNRVLEENTALQNKLEDRQAWADERAAVNIALRTKYERLRQAAEELEEEGTARLTENHEALIAMGAEFLGRWKRFCAALAEDQTHRGAI